MGQKVNPIGLRLGINRNWESRWFPKFSTMPANVSEDDKIIYELFNIISQNQGKREVTLTIKSKLGDVELDSGYYVNNNAEGLLKELDGVYII